MRYPKSGYILFLPVIAFVFLYSILNVVFIQLTENHSIPIKEGVTHTYLKAGEKVQIFKDKVYGQPQEEFHPPILAKDSLNSYPSDSKLIWRNYMIY